jgi:transposase
VRDVGSELATAILRVYPTAVAFQGVAVRRLGGLRYAGQHKVGTELAAALLEAAAASVGQHHGAAYQVQVQDICEDLDVLRRRLRTLDRDIERLLERHEVGTLLTTIDGIGPQTAARLVATFGDFRGVRSGAALACYVGAIPGLRQSGKRTSSRARLTPIGAARLRAKLYMPVLSAVRCTPGCARTTRRSSRAASCPRSPSSRRCVNCSMPSTASPPIAGPSCRTRLPKRRVREKHP